VVVGRRSSLREALAGGRLGEFRGRGGTGIRSSPVLGGVRVHYGLWRYSVQHHILHLRMSARAGQQRNAVSHMVASARGLPACLCVSAAPHCTWSPRGVFISYQQQSYYAVRTLLSLLRNSTKCSYKVPRTTVLSLQPKNRLPVEGRPSTRFSAEKWQHCACSLCV
jgi:hypothetical protein